MPLNAVILRIQPSGMRVDRRGPVRTVSMLRTASDEAEKKIEALLHQASQEKGSLKLDLSGLLLQSVSDTIQNLSSTLVKLDLSNNNLEVRLFQECSLFVVQGRISVKRLTEI